jgi:hypothetical protein
MACCNDAENKIKKTRKNAGDARQRIDKNPQANATPPQKNAMTRRREGGKGPIQSDVVVFVVVVRLSVCNMRPSRSKAPSFSQTRGPICRYPDTPQRTTSQHAGPHGPLFSDKSPPSAHAYARTVPIQSASHACVSGTHCSSGSWRLNVFLVQYLVDIEAPPLARVRRLGSPLFGAARRRVARSHKLAVTIRSARTGFHV